MATRRINTMRREVNKVYVPIWELSEEKQKGIAINRENFGAMSGAGYMSIEDAKYYFDGGSCEVKILDQILGYHHTFVLGRQLCPPGYPMPPNQGKIVRCTIGTLNEKEHEEISTEELKHVVDTLHIHFLSVQTCLREFEAELIRRGGDGSE